MSSSYNCGCWGEMGRHKFIKRVSLNINYAVRMIGENNRNVYRSYIMTSCYTCQTSYILGFAREGTISRTPSLVFIWLHLFDNTIQTKRRTRGIFYQ